jgi:hypothetical protein
MFGGNAMVVSAENGPEGKFVDQSAKFASTEGAVQLADPADRQDVEPYSLHRARKLVVTCRSLNTSVGCHERL